MKPNRSALLVLAALALAPLGHAAESASFDQLLQTGFSRVSAAATATGAPAASAAGDRLGVYLKSGRSGSIFFCGASGCREILSGGAAFALPVGDGLYFTGPESAGYCDPSGCRTLLLSAVTYPLNAGPDGDIYAADSGGLWHCAPSGCARAFTGRVDVRANYMDGAWKTNGDFVASPAGRAFWCSRGVCRPIADTELVIVDEFCNNASPTQISYGFWGLDFYRCTPSGCRKLMDSDNIQTYSECAFDASGRIYMESRAQVAIASVRCGETCEPSPRKVTDVAPDKTRAPQPRLDRATGTDGALYRLADRSGTPEPQGAARDVGLPPIVLRGERALAFDAPVSCWDWSDGDPDDEDPASWYDSCQLIR